MLSFFFHIVSLSLQKKTTTEDQRAEFEQILARLDGFSDKDMNEVIRKYKFKSPTTGNELSDPVSFNLMFPTQIGPTGDFQAYLRPETAQGIFINFKRLLEFNQVFVNILVLDLVCIPITCTLLETFKMLMH